MRATKSSARTDNRPNRVHRVFGKHSANICISIYYCPRMRHHIQIPCSTCCYLRCGNNLIRGSHICYQLTGYITWRRIYSDHYFCDARRDRHTKSSAFNRNKATCCSLWTADYCDSSRHSRLDLYRGLIAPDYSHTWVESRPIILPDRDVYWPWPCSVYERGNDKLVGPWCQNYRDFWRKYYRWPYYHDSSDNSDRYCHRWEVDLLQIDYLWCL